MSEFIIRAEKFKFGILDKVPEAASGECILLYRKDRGENGSMIIESSSKPLSADVRRGRYNMKVTFSLKERLDSLESNLVMKGCDFYFHVKISYIYQLKSPKDYYFRDNLESEKIVKDAIRKSLGKNEEKWGLRDGNELEKALYKGVEKAFQKSRCLVLKNVRIDVEPDADASRVIVSDNDTNIEIHKSENAAKLEIARKENEERVLASDHSVQMKKAEHLQRIAGVFGEIAPVAEEHLKGNMDGKELYEYIKEKKERDLNILAHFKENDWISDEVASDTLLGIIDNSNFKLPEQQLQLEGEVQKQIEQFGEDDLHDNIIQDGDSL